MPHQLLSGSHRDARPCQHAPERRSECMQVDLPAASIPSSDPGSAAVSMESADQVGGDIEYRVRRASSLDPPTKHQDKVETKGDRVVLTVLRDGTAQTDDRNWPVEIQVSNSQLADFTDSQAGPRQEHVQVGSVMT